MGALAGRLPQPAIERMEALGGWLKANGEGIYIGRADRLQSSLGHDANAVGQRLSFFHIVSRQQDGQAGYSLDVVVPEYVERIDRIYMAHDSNLPGAPLVAKFDLGCLGSINGGGVVNVTLDIPADFEVYDSNFNLVKNNRVSFENYRFKQGESIIEFVIYIASITNSSSNRTSCTDSGFDSLQSGINTRKFGIGCILAQILGSDSICNLLIYRTSSTLHQCGCSFVAGQLAGKYTSERYVRKRAE